MRDRNQQILENVTEIAITRAHEYLNGVSYLVYPDTLTFFLEKKNALKELIFTLHAKDIPQDLQQVLAIALMFPADIAVILKATIKYFLNDSTDIKNSTQQILECIECTGLIYGTSSQEFKEMKTFLADSVKLFIEKIFLFEPDWRVEQHSTAIQEAKIAVAFDCLIGIFGAHSQEFSKNQNLAKRCGEAALKKITVLGLSIGSAAYEDHIIKLLPEINMIFSILNKNLSQDEIITNYNLPRYYKLILTEVNDAQTNILKNCKEAILETFSPAKDFATQFCQLFQPTHKHNLANLQQKISVELESIKIYSPLMQVQRLLGLLCNKHNELIKTDPVTANMISHFLHTHRGLVKNKGRPENGWLFIITIEKNPNNGLIHCTLSKKNQEIQRFLDITAKFFSDIELPRITHKM